MPIPRTKTSRTQLMDMARALLAALHQSRRQSWIKNGSQVPWSEMAAEKCAAGIIELIPENERLRERLRCLEGPERKAGS